MARKDIAWTKMRCSVSNGIQLLSLLFLAVLLVVGCSKEIRVDDGDLVFVGRPDIQKAMEEVDLGDENHLVVVDPRRAERYQAGHLASAINIPLPSAVAHDLRIRRAKVIYVYGEFSHDPLAKAMCKKLLALGYGDVRMYEGGLEDWRAGRLPLVTSTEEN